MPAHVLDDEALEAFFLGQSHPGWERLPVLVQMDSDVRLAATGPAPQPDLELLGQFLGHGPASAPTGSPANGHRAGEGPALALVPPPASALPAPAPTTPNTTTPNTTTPNTTTPNTTGPANPWPTAWTAPATPTPTSAPARPGQGRPEPSGTVIPFRRRPRLGTILGAAAAAAAAVISVAGSTGSLPAPAQRAFVRVVEAVTPFQVPEPGPRTTVPAPVTTTTIAADQATAEPGPLAGVPGPPAGVPGPPSSLPAPGGGSGVPSETAPAPGIDVARQTPAGSFIPPFAGAPDPDPGPASSSQTSVQPGPLAEPGPPAGVPGPPAQGGPTTTTTTAPPAPPAQPGPPSGGAGSGGLDRARQTPGAPFIPQGGPAGAR
jgi:hypothetical protein